MSSVYRRKETYMKIGNDQYVINDYIVRMNSITEKSKFRIETINPKDYLTTDRLDLLIKLIYISSYDQGIDLSYAKELYLRHIECFSAGTFVEPGKEEKNSKEAFIKHFNELLDAYRTNKFDKRRELIPLDRKGILLDGAHRLSVAIHYNVELDAIRLEDVTGYVYDVAFFRQRKLPEHDIYMAIRKYASVCKDCYAACFWPRGVYEHGKYVDAMNILKEAVNVIDVQEITLDKLALRNFMIQIYGHQEWVGSEKDGYYGVNGKVEPCYKKGTPLMLVVFQGKDLEQVVKVKSQIRDCFGIGNHSVHITDNNIETMQVIDLLMDITTRKCLNQVDIALLKEIQNKEGRFMDSYSGEVIMDPEETLRLFGYNSNEICICESLYGSEIMHNPENFFSFGGKKLFTVDILAGHSNLRISGKAKIKKKVVTKFKNVQRKTSLLGCRIKQKTIVLLDKVGILKVFVRIKRAIFKK